MQTKRGITVLSASGLAMASMLAACASDHNAATRTPTGRDSATKAPVQWPTQAAPVWAAPLAHSDADEGEYRAIADARANTNARAYARANTTAHAEMSALSMPVMWGRVDARADMDMVAGTLVTMTGVNVRDGDELRMGIEPVTRANDPAAIGVVVPEGRSAFDRSLEGRRLERGVGREGDIVIGAFAHEVATAGLARVWVVEESPARGGVVRDLSPGDLLISADAPGCAMLDNTTRFEVGYVVARVAERVSWSQANPSDTGPDGRRRMLAAVMLERFVRPSLDGLSRAELLDLQDREFDRWQEDWERDAQRRYRWDDMTRTWDEMDRFKKKWGDDWDDDKTWRDLRDSGKRMREQDDQLKRLRDDLDKSRRELEDTRRNLDDLSRDVKGGRSDSGSRGGSDGGVKPAPR
jgi:hypothetical protein